MASVTQRIKSIQQPMGGYLPIKLFSTEMLNDGIVLNEEENIHPSLVGLAVDYLTRFMSGDSVEQAFNISTLGAKIIDMQHTASALKSTVKGLDDISIISACKLAGFDVCFRASVTGYKPIEEINPDKDTIENIRTMVNRCLTFWKKYGPVINSGPTFEGGYTEIVTAGDGDYVTRDTLWDFKVSRKPPTSKNTLQILMYYVMGLHSVHGYFKNLTYLGFFNPRLNTVYICDVSVIPKETIKEIENNVICYYGAPKNVVPKISSAKRNSAVSAHSPSSSAIRTTTTDISVVTRRKGSETYTTVRSVKVSTSQSGDKSITTEYKVTQTSRHFSKSQKVFTFIYLTVLVFFVAFIIIVCALSLS